MKVFVPCDAIEARKAVLAAAGVWGPVYMRFGREKSAVITTEETPFTPGKAEVFWDSSLRSERLKPQAVLIACGNLVYNALLAAKELEKEKIGTIVLNNHTLKPMDEKRIIEMAKKTGAAVTVEEHQITGGLGGAVAEVLSRNHPVPMEFIGLQDTFGESGNPDELMEKYGMGAEDIIKAVKKVIKRK